MSSTQSILRPLACATTLALCALPALAIDQATAQAVLKLAPDSGAVGDLVKDVIQDMPIGTPPAAVVLGVSANQVPRVTSFRQAALTLSNGLGKKGQITQAIGAEFLPAMVLQPLRWDQLNSFGMRAWARTALSFATLPSEKDGSARTAIGLQTVLYSKEADEAVTLAAGKDCTAIARNFAAAPAPPPLQPGEPPLPGFSDQDQALLDACVQLIDRTLNRWNPTTVAIGVGQAYYAADARVAHLSSTAGSYWITGAWGMDFDGPAVAAPQRKGVGLTAHWRRSRDERVDDPSGADTLLAESARLWALNLRVGTPRVAVLAEHSRRRATLAGYADEQRRRSFLGAELRVAEGLYFALGVADDRGARDGSSQKAALANLKWGFGDKPVLGGR